MLQGRLTNLMPKRVECPVIQPGTLVIPTEHGHAEHDVGHTFLEPVAWQWSSWCGCKISRAGAD